MVRENHKHLVFLRLFADILTILFAWMLSYIIRFNIIGGALPNLGSYYIKLSLAVISFYIFGLFKYGLYPSQRFIPWQRELQKTLKASCYSFAVLIIFNYFILNHIASRLTLGIFFITSSSFMILNKILIRNILINLRSRGKNLRYILPIGHGENLEKYISTISLKKSMGVVVLDPVVPDSKSFDLAEHIKGKTVDQIVIGFPRDEIDIEKGILQQCSNQLTSVIVLANTPYSFIGSKIIDFKGIPVLEFNSPSIGIRSRILKRTMDIIGSITGLILLSPVFLVLSIAVKLTSKGPVFYGQKRMTRDGKVFKMWKFRSMKVGAEKIGSGWTVKDDPRRTVIGPFLRSTSLDELPQLWNVFIGNMSLVGPRPERPVFIDKFKDEIPAYMLRHKVKGGITGWAQVNGLRGDTSIPLRIEYDLYYIKNWGISLDIKILLLTIIKGFINKNAY